MYTVTRMHVGETVNVRFISKLMEVFLHLCYLMTLPILLLMYHFSVIITKSEKIFITNNVRKYENNYICITLKLVAITENAYYCKH